MTQTSKIGRGLGEELRKHLQSNRVLSKMIRQKEYFFGIRNDYFNIYYRGASMGRFKLSRGNLVVQVHNKYLGNNKGNTATLKIEDYIGWIDKIKENIDQHKKQVKTVEKEYQQTLASNYYNNIKEGVVCIDMEYVRELSKDKKDKNGRVDIVTLSAVPNEEGKYEVTLIELKQGNGALQDVSASKCEGNVINIDDINQPLKSGLLGHIGKYYRYLKDESGYQQLKEEILGIIKDYKELGVLSKDLYQHITVDDFGSQPKVAFLIYSGGSTLQQIKDPTANYLFEGRTRSSQYNVQKSLKTEKGISIDVRQPVHINEKIYPFNFYFREGGVREQCTLVLEVPYQFK